MYEVVEAGENDWLAEQFEDQTPPPAERGLPGAGISERRG
jgi:hypothetical protein